MFFCQLFCFGERETNRWRNFSVNRVLLHGNRQYSQTRYEKLVLTQFIQSSKAFNYSNHLLGDQGVGKWKDRYVSLHIRLSRIMASDLYYVQVGAMFGLALQPCTPVPEPHSFAVLGTKSPLIYAMQSKASTLKSGKEISLPRLDADSPFATSYYLNAEANRVKRYESSPGAQG
jgi:hypothetical protein